MTGGAALPLAALRWRETIGCIRRHRQAEHLLAPGMLRQGAPKLDAMVCNRPAAARH